MESNDGGKLAGRDSVPERGVLRRGTGAWRAAARALAAIQLAAATLVPVAHPFLHRPADGPSESRALVSAPAGDAEALRDVDPCPACLASAGVTAPPGGLPDTSCRTWRTTTCGAVDQDLPAPRAGPANRVRAPPLS